MGLAGNETLFLEAAEQEVELNIGPVEAFRVRTKQPTSARLDASGPRPSVSNRPRFSSFSAPNRLISSSIAKTMPAFGWSCRLSPTCDLGPYLDLQLLELCRPPEP